MNTISTEPASSSIRPNTQSTESPSDSTSSTERARGAGMSYARARLWLGITGVGTLVVLTATLVATGANTRWFFTSPQAWWRELGQLAIFFGAYAVVMLPLDWLGGYRLPQRFGRGGPTSREWWSLYLRASAGQILFYSVATWNLVTLSRWLGTAVGGGVAIASGLMVWSVLRALFLQRRLISASSDDQRLKEALYDCRRWGIDPAPVWIVRHRDPGFTGGIVAVGGQPRVVIPESWLALPANELSAAIARRSLIISRGGFWTGSLAAFTWNLVGFALAVNAPGGGLDTVAHAVGTTCWFTLWSFVGLLILPTFSRRAALAFDQQLVDRRVSPETLVQLASSLDRKQDDEPTRGAWIETIFHPLPSVANRLPNSSKSISNLGSQQLWNIARNALVLSWPFSGLLSRAVHCNVGRPELWVILPTD